MLETGNTVAVHAPAHDMPGASAMPYLAPRWLPGGHLQTIYPATCLRKPAVRYRRERWQAPDGDFLDLDFVDGASSQPFVLLFHGLEGSSDSHYARALMALVVERGWSGVVVHFRGCRASYHDMAAFCRYWLRLAHLCHSTQTETVNCGSIGWHISEFISSFRLAS